jgi:hypothetical protein
MVSGTESVLAGNAVAVARELDWLAALVDWRLAGAQTGPLPEPPPLNPEESAYGDLLERLELRTEERLVLAVALSPHVRPACLDALFESNERTGRGRSEVGGVQGRAHSGFLPTAETALFLLAGRDLRARFLSERLFQSDHRLARLGLLQVEEAPQGEPRTSGLLVVPEAALGTLTAGVARRPEFDRDFPARRLGTDMAWEDLVLTPETSEQLRELIAWAKYEGRLRATGALAARLRGGYRAVFYGPPGTGKTLAATLLGQRVGRDVYRVMLSTIVSKYIGETAKNLERLFATAERLGCILFFDEADALFGKRTSVSDARDRYANQEISYLLQRVEDYRGMVVLATNLESNMDEAFMRRFHAVINFPMPGPEERRRLWREALPSNCQLEAGLDLNTVADQHTLSGAAIVNVLQYATLMAFDDGDRLKQTHLQHAIRRELQKDGKTL